MEWMKRLDMDPSFADRYLNEGFSGGEKKRNEILQMAILEPEMAILDETDSGLDIDALKVVAHGVDEVRTDRPELGVLAITHYQRLLDYLQPDRVHILIDGRIVDSGGPELAERLEREGYESWRTAPRRHRVAVDRRLTARPRPPTCSTSSASRRTSRSSTGRCTGSRLVYLDSANTVAEAPRRARRHRDATTRRLQRQRPPRHLPHRRGGDGRARRAPGPRSPASSAPAPTARSCSPRTPPRRSTSWPRPGAGPTCGRATPWCSPSSSTTPTSSRGTCCVDELGIELRWIPVGDDGHLDLTDLDRLVDGAKLVSFTAMSNVLGTITPVERLVDAAHAAGAIAVVDASQYVPHLATDVPGLGRRLRRLHRPQDAAARPASACCGAARRSSTPCPRSSAAAR